MSSPFNDDGYFDALAGRPPYPPDAFRIAGGYEVTVYRSEYLRGYAEGKQERETNKPKEKTP